MNSLFKVGDVLQTRFVRRVMTVREESVVLLLDINDDNHYVMLRLFSRMGTVLRQGNNEIITEPEWFVASQYVKI